MNPVAMTIINPQKEYWPSRGSAVDRTSDLLFSSPQCYRLSFGARLSDYLNLYTLSNNKISYSSELKVFADNMSDVTHIMKLSLKGEGGWKHYGEKDNMLVFSSTGQRPASYCHSVVSVMRPSVRPCAHP